MMPRLTTEAFDMDTSLLPPRDPIILKKEIDKIKKQIKSLKNQLANTSDDISTNALSRDLARAESMLKKLEWQMPAQIKFFTRQKQQLTKQQD